jgi:2-polyprenyl-6-methoxyphenol hydroxylase-like FAD-dependent oxidoreductase
MRIAIAGAGIGGLTAAIGLQQCGHEIVLFERAPTIQPVGAGLALAANAIRAFGELGLADAVIAAGHVLNTFRIKDEQGRVLTETDARLLTGKYGVNNFAIHRADLHALLMSYLPNALHLNKTVVRAEPSASEVKVFLSDGSQQSFDFLIAANGIHSQVRRQLDPTSEPRYAGYTCWRGVVEGVDAGLDFGEATETWGRKGRFGIVPLSKNRVYWFACINAKANDPRFSRVGITDLENHFGTFHSPIPALIQSTPEEALLHNDILDIKPLRHFAFGRIVLLGDAAHATTPNLGQGACMAIEDAAILTRCIQNAEDPVAAGLNFEARRIERTTRIVNRSWRMGKLAQLSHPMLIALRNLVVRNTPAREMEKQLDFLYNVSFQ